MADFPGGCTTRVGMGFAIPSDTVRYVVSQILHYGHVRRPWLGANLQKVASKKLGMMVLSVVPGGPAALAGIRTGDFITSINGRPIHGMSDVMGVLEHSAVGQNISVVVIRGNATLTIGLRLQEIPQLPAKKAS